MFPRLRNGRVYDAKIESIWLFGAFHPKDVLFPPKQKVSKTTRIKGMRRISRQPTKTKIVTHFSGRNLLCSLLDIDRFEYCHHRFHHSDTGSNHISWLSQKKQRIVLEIWHCTNKQVHADGRTKVTFSKKGLFFSLFIRQISIFCCFSLT